MSWQILYHRTSFLHIIQLLRHVPGRVLPQAPPICHCPMKSKCPGFAFDWWIMASRHTANLQQDKCLLDGSVGIGLTFCQWGILFHHVFSSLECHHISATSFVSYTSLLWFSWKALKAWSLTNDRNTPQMRHEQSNWNQQRFSQLGKKLWSEIWMVNMKALDVCVCGLFGYYIPAWQESDTLCDMHSAIVASEILFEVWGRRPGFEVFLCFSFYQEMVTHLDCLLCGWNV